MKKNCPHNHLKILYGKLILIFISVFILNSNAIAQHNLANLETGMSNLIDSFYVNDTLPGVVVGVWTKDFQYKKVVGKADLETNVDRKFDDKIRIGSITKTFVATVILQLAGDGKIGLDDSLAKYYPDYPDGNKITIREMLDMTSGIPDYIEDPAVLQSFVYDRLDKYTPLELYKITKKMKPFFPQGTGWGYSNGSYNILGMLIEKITGNKLENEISDRIIKPLGLKNTSFPTSPYMEGQYSHGYMRNDTTNIIQDVTIMDPSIGWAAGAMISNINDLEIYAMALANGTMLNKNMQEERLKFVNTGVRDFFKYGLGIFSMSGFIGHNGGITGYNTTMCYNPELDILIIVSVNRYGGGGGMSDKIFAEIAKLIYPDKKLFE